MLKKTLISDFHAAESNNVLTVDKKIKAKFFKDFLTNLAETFLIKLPNAPNNYNLESVLQYYSQFITEKPFHLSGDSEEAFKIMQNIVILKDGAEILAKPLREICNLSITSKLFQLSESCKAQSYF